MGNSWNITAVLATPEFGVCANAVESGPEPTPVGSLPTNKLEFRRINMYSSVLLTIVLGLFLQVAQSPNPEPQNVAPPKQYFIAVFSRGPAWDDGKPANEQVGFKEHSDNLRRLRTEKKIA